MLEDTIRLRLRTGARDPPQTAHVLGLLYLAGALLVLLSLWLPSPEGANVAGLLAIAGVAVGVGCASIAWARHARIWTVQAVLAGGTTLICLCVYFAGVASGIYSSMFVWVVLVAASFFSGWAVAAHLVWIAIASALTLTTITEPSGFSGITRWALGNLVLVVTAAVMSEIVAGRKSTEEQLRAAQSELRHLAHHDPLTGLANRRRFDEEITRELSRAKRQGAPLCLISLDLDDFKQYNDLHGHVAGDRLLKRAASVWARALRAEDLLARLGGDEFVAVLPDCPSAEAERVAQRLCRDISVQCSCSSGIASWDGHESAEELRTRADKAMYETKNPTTPGRPLKLAAVDAIALD